MSEQLLHQRGNLGWIEVICGSMFSGKSEEHRYTEDHIVSHSEMKIKSQLVSQAREILDLLDGRTRVVGVDEGQFFDMELVCVSNRLADAGKLGAVDAYEARCRLCFEPPPG